MTRVDWGAVGERFYEAGVDRGVLYVGDSAGVPWVGLVSVTESPTNSKSKANYLDGVKYLNRVSSGEFAGTIEAYTYPDEFAKCDGTAPLGNGLFATHQRRYPFGFSYRTLIGNDTEGLEHGYKIHLVYDATAEPSPHANQTLSDSDDAFNFSWNFTTRPPVVGGIRPTAHFVVDSRETPPALLGRIEDILYGTAQTDPRLPSAGEMLFLFASFETTYIDAGGPLDPTYFWYDAGGPTTTHTEIIDGGTP